MLKRIARAMRKLANRIDPPPPGFDPDALLPVVAPEPLAFVETFALAKEIERRSDVVLLWWGRTLPDGDLRGAMTYKLRPQQFTPIVAAVAETIERQLAEEG